MKRCTKCLEHKPVEAYKKNKSAKDGLYPSCKNCNKRTREGLPPLRLVQEQELLSQGLKKCFTCEDVKQVSEFHNHSGYEHGLHYACKPCTSKRHKELYSPVLKQVYHANKCARERGLDALLIPEEWFAIRERFKDDTGTVCCAYCSRKEKDEKNPHHIEHFIPLSEGGGTTENNVLPVCSYCNRGKDRMDFSEWCIDYFSFFGIEPETIIHKVANYFKEYYPDVLKNIG